MAAKFLLSGFVRLTSTNNKLRILDSGTERIFRITEGTFSLGFGASSPGSSSDSVSYGFTSLLQQLKTDFANTARFTPPPGAAYDWDAALQTEYNGSSGIAASATGHVFIKAESGITFSFSHTETTISPEWFGVGKTSNVYNDHIFTGTTFEDVSDFSSALAIVGGRTIGAEELTEDVKERGFMADDGSVYWETMGDSADILRTLVINGPGLPRDTADNDYHSMRRFLRFIKLAGAGRRFYYIPDISRLNWGNYNPDDTSANARWGQQLFRLDPRSPSRFAHPQRFPQYNREWQLPMRVVSLPQDTTPASLFIDQKTGSFGTQVLTAGAATSATAIDLTNVSLQDDIAVLLLEAANSTSTALDLDLWKDSGGTEHWARYENISANSNANLRETHHMLMIRVSDPATSIYYEWSNTNGTLDVWVVSNLRGLTWL